ncbi:hypothetical protein F4780DRAFT_794504 [Xylariomycetidae sp. FL0641]|nr:hypothetical protein F4780DRAFT_794504 [Xylariomycetidae sp. FL0641]
MLFHFTAALAALALGQANAQTTDANACAVGCVNGVLTDTAKLGCGLGDRLCVCGKLPDVQNGIRDCITSACASTADAQLPLAADYGNQLCIAASSSASAAAAATETPAATTEAAAAPAPTTAEEAAPTTASPSTADADTATTASPTSVEAASEPTGTTAETTGTTLATSVTAASETSATETSATETSDTTLLSSSSVHSTAGAAAASATDEASDDSESSGYDSGLSTAVKAGIGAGVAVLAIMVGIITACLCLRRKQKKHQNAHRANNLQISKPMPAETREYNQSMRRDVGLSRTFTASPQNEAAQPSPYLASPTSPTSIYTDHKSSYYSGLESNAGRYEDQLPRTQPRTMI